MEFEKNKKNESPWTKANFLSRHFFWWLIPFLIKGSKGNLKLSDIPDCPDVESSEQIGKSMQKEWDRELKKLKSGKQPSLTKAVFRVIGLSFCLNSFSIFVLECFIRVLQSVFLGYLIKQFARMEEGSKFELWLFAAGLCLLSVAYVSTVHPYIFISYRLGMRMRIACCTLIYRKSLKISQAAFGATTVGQMVNLLSNDVNRFDRGLELIPYLIFAPMQTIIVICIIWTHIGYASISVLCLLLVYVPFQGFLGKVFSKLRLKTALLTDERIRLMNEVIGGMRVIKMYGWEIPFANSLDLSRRKEVQKIRRTLVLHSINLALFIVSSNVILLITFAIFLLAVGGDLTPEKVFVCMALFGNLRVSMIWVFPSGIVKLADTIASLKRIEKFLLLEEQSETSLLDVSNQRPKLDQCGVWMHSVKASWNKEAKLTLRNVTLSVKPGELLVIVGPVGCGKTSLLMSILGELPITSGEVKLRGKVAYAAQEPWVFGGTIRQNVIFGNEFDEAKYKKLLSICALDEDIKQFPYGDQTAVGERGIKLSGGQKARVNLARAMYFDADIFLLDDPLSAVDSSVSKQLFEKCINGYLKDKVRILATHQIQFLKGASQILVLKEGGCLALGTYEQLIESGVDLEFLTEENEHQHHYRLSSMNSVTANPSMVEKIPDDTVSLCLDKCKLSVNSSVDANDEKQTANEKAPELEEEFKSTGTVKFHVYKEYIKSGGGPFLRFLLVICYIFAQAFINGSDFWLAHWTNLEQRKYYVKDCWVGANKTYLNQTGLYNDTYGVFDRSLIKQIMGNVSEDCFSLTRSYLEDENDAHNNINRNFNLSIYAGFVLLIFVLSLVQQVTFFLICMKASISLHNKMFQAVLRSPVAFFDSNPVGRVLNRFSKDVGIIDDYIPLAARDAIWMFCTVIGVFCVVAIVQPWLLIPSVVICILLVLVTSFYLPTARDVKRYEGITRSPVMSHLSTSLCGLTTIRAFKVQRAFEISFDHYQDQHTATWFTFLSVTRWVAIATDWFSTAYITCAIVSMVLLSDATDPSLAGRAGLAIGSTLQLLGYFQWAVKQSTEVESQMTSVERVIEYSNLKPEADLENDKDKKPPKKWPSKGYIVYQDVSLRYSPNAVPFLKNINFEIYPEEKIGIVGRTGAGKSSLISTLFRMFEPDGVIKIDGINTKDVRLHDLRKNISIIPQDPVLFIGPVRRNLDPFNEHEDNELWQALEGAYLKHAIEEMPGGLDAKVSENGSNFSVGQKQLICLARAILRRNKILVLDEATANVDPKTDSLIQETIRHRFKHCTVLTIAHRLHTIMDSDRVLVLEAGEIKEFDEPYTLLQNPDSLFSRMVRMTGPTMEKQLQEAAHSKYLEKCAKKEGNTSVFGGPGGDGVIDVDGKWLIQRL